MVSDTGSGTGTSITTPSITLEARRFASAVWIWDNSVSSYINNTIEAETLAGTAFTVFDATADFWYIGSESRFDLMQSILSTVGSLGNLTYEYSRSDRTWTRFIPLRSYAFARTGVEQFPDLRNWAAFAFSATSPHAATPPDTLPRYWIRISASSISASPTILQLEIRPLAYYCTPSDIANFLQLTTDFTSSTNPTRVTVENYIRRAESIIDYRTAKSWRLNLQTNEEHDYNILGIQLLKNNPRRVLQFEIWNGSDYDTKTEGRSNDYFLVAELGMVQVSRYYLLPARMQSSGYGQYGWGEFEKNTRISYTYGRDIYDDEQGFMITDLTIKIAASEILTNHDFSILIALGADRVALQEKVRMWKEEIDDTLDRLRGWTVV